MDNSPTKRFESNKQYADGCLYTQKVGRVFANRRTPASCHYVSLYPTTTGRRRAASLARLQPTGQTRLPSSATPGLRRSSDRRLTGPGRQTAGPAQQPVEPAERWAVSRWSVGSDHHGGRHTSTKTRRWTAAKRARDAFLSRRMSTADPYSTAAPRRPPGFDAPSLFRQLRARPPTESRLHRSRDRRPVATVTYHSRRSSRRVTARPERHVP